MSERRLPPLDYGKLVQDAGTRAEVAETYAAMLLGDTRAAEWHAMNKSILFRWRPSSLAWIKKRAWWLASRGVTKIPLAEPASPSPRADGDADGDGE